MKMLTKEQEVEILKVVLGMLHTEEHVYLCIAIKSMMMLRLDVDYHEADHCTTLIAEIAQTLRGDSSVEWMLFGKPAAECSLEDLQLSKTHRVMMVNKMLERRQS